MTKHLSERMRVSRRVSFRGSLVNWHTEAGQTSQKAMVKAEAAANGRDWPAGGGTQPKAKNTHTRSQPPSEETHSSSWAAEMDDERVAACKSKGSEAQRRLQGALAPPP